jgi:HEAT repeat protein
MADDPLSASAEEQLFAAALADLTSEDPDRPSLALLELHRRGTPQIHDVALRLTRSPDDRERELGIMVLRELGPWQPDGRREFSATVIPRLLDLLATEEDPFFERLLLQALAFQGAREALVEFTARVRHPDTGVRRSVAFQLPSVIDQDDVDPAAAEALEVLTRDVDADTRYYALHALVAEGLNLDRPWVEGIATRLVQDPDRKIRHLALNFLPGSEQLYAPWTSAQLASAVADIDTGDDDGWIQWNYVSELRRRGDQASADVAVAALSDPSPQLRIFGAWVLSQFGDGPVLERPHRPAAITALMSAASTETVPDVIDALVSALCWQQATDALPWLLELCRDGDDDVRTTLAMSLTAFGPHQTDTIKALTALLTDPAASVRDWAGFAFANDLPTADSVRLRNQLLVLTQDPDRVTASQAIHALILRSDQRAIPPLAEALTEDPDDATPLLLEAAQAASQPAFLPGLHHLLRSPEYEDDPELEALITQIQRENTNDNNHP